MPVFTSMTRYAFNAVTVSGAALPADLSSRTQYGTAEQRRRFGRLWLRGAGTLVLVGHAFFALRQGARLDCGAGLGLHVGA